MTEMEKISTGIQFGELNSLKGLKACRKRARITQAEAALLTGTNIATWLNWEQGRNWPSSRALPVIASTFGCTMEELYLGPGGGAA